MKFAKTLQAEEIPEWQDKYLDYKLGKKKVKGVSHAIQQLDLHNENSLQAIHAVDERRAEFFHFLDQQLQKIDEFYQAQEADAEKRAHLLREQLNTLAESRDSTPAQALLSRPAANDGHLNPNGHVNENGDPTPKQNGLTRFKPFQRIWQQASTWIPRDAQRDYERKPETMPLYFVAKRRLKAQVQEAYRHLEMIRSFSDTNRTAFRKILKKYTKGTGAMDTGDSTAYMEDKVEKAYFAVSDDIQALFDEYERLYAAHFEYGNKKAAASKLRTRNAKTSNFTAPCGRAGFAFGAGLFASLLGLICGVQDLWSEDPFIADRAVYLLQLYGGYFLILLMGAMFLLACAVFERYRINYRFIFELNPKTSVNWYQMAELVAWLLLTQGLVMAFNFAFKTGGEGAYVLWIWVLAGCAGVSITLPAPIFYHRTRAWILTTLARQFVPLFTTVEFRDFFLGDILCSLTYALGNLFLFGCVSALGWNMPSQCSSSHNVGIGIMTCVPGTIRALQCVKRWHDEKAAFPHGANLGKYCLTIGQYALLCAYRLNVNKNWSLACFAAVASVNSIYCIIWDIQYDWSLGNPSAQHWGLRNTLVFRKQVWVYYTAIVIDIILRLNWIPYCIWTKDAQHASIVSFVVAFSEILRRGMWTIFRVENEHAANVERQKATRDLVLPYKLTPDGQLDRTTGPADEESLATTPAMSALSRVATMMRSGHVHDYERRRRGPDGDGRSWEEENDSDDDE